MTKQVFSFIQSSVVFLQVHKGFGRSAEQLEPAQVTSMQKVGTPYLNRISRHVFQ